MFIRFLSSLSRFRAVALPISPVGLIYAASLALAVNGYASITDQFIRLTTFPTGGSPQAVASADFNRDGKTDVAVLNTNGVLSILLGTGSGTLQTAKTIATITPAPGRFLFAEDFNGDGNHDLLVFSGNAVMIYPGRGDGSFGGSVTIGLGLSSPQVIAVGDFNGDLRPDVVAADSSNTKRISVLLGKPGGYFHSPIITATNVYPQILALGDTNADGHLDAVVADETGDFQVLLGRGNGAFAGQAPISFGMLGLDLQPNVYAVADFDGKPDLVVGNETYYPQFGNGQVCILHGNGDGTFTGNNSRCFLSPDSFAPMQVIDLNGRPGLAFASYPIYVLTSSAPGRFSEASYAAGGGPIAVGDFNADGRQDLAAAKDRGVEVLLNAGGSGVLRAPIDVSLSLIGPPKITSINTTDFNGDGFADLAIEENYDDHGFLSPSVGTVLGGMNQMIPAGIAWPQALGNTIVSMSNPPAIGDFNHDGKLDMAFSTIDYDFDFGTVGSLQVIFGDGKGQFPTLGPVLHILTNFIAAGYFNGDGSADLASLDEDGLAILLGKGDGTFAAPVSYPAGTNPVFVLQRDLNGDGKRDLVVVNQNSDNISVLLGNGDGTFKPQKTFPAGTLPKWAVTGDFNRDGKIDVAVASSGGISVLLGNGDGTFKAEKTYSTTGALTGIVQASVRQDGIECLLAIDSSAKRFVLLPGVGDGSFGSPVFFPLDLVPTAIVTADLSGDGATDIALLGSNGRVAVFYNQGGNYVSLSSSSTTPLSNQPVMLTARVTPGYGEIATVSGSVTFKDGTKFLGTARLQGRTASITTQFAAGSHQIRALYAGNGSLNPNHSPTLVVVTQ